MEVSWGLLGPLGGLLGASWRPLGGLLGGPEEKIMLNIILKGFHVACGGLVFSLSFEALKGPPFGVVLGSKFVSWNDIWFFLWFFGFGLACIGFL